MRERETMKERKCEGETEKVREIGRGRRFSAYVLFS